MTEVGLCNFDVGSLLNKCDAEVERAVNRFKEGRSVSFDTIKKLCRIGTVSFYERAGQYFACLEVVASDTYVMAFGMTPQQALNSLSLHPTVQALLEEYSEAKKASEGAV